MTEGWSGSAMNVSVLPILPRLLAYWRLRLDDFRIRIHQRHIVRPILNLRDLQNEPDSQGQPDIRCAKMPSHHTMLIQRHAVTPNIIKTCMFHDVRTARAKSVRSRRKKDTFMAVDRSVQSCRGMTDLTHDDSRVHPGLEDA